MAEHETVPPRPIMATELLKAAIEGNEQVLTEMMRLEQDHSNQTAVSIESSTDGESHNHIQSANFMGNTVLHILCSYGHDVLSSKVCKKDGSLLRARNKMLETPLHCATKAGEGEIIIKLIEFARTKGESELREVLRSKNKSRETALHMAARHNHKGIIDELLKVDQELVYEVDYDGNCALHVAIDRGDRGVVASMIGRLPDQKIDPRIYCSRPKRTTSHSNGREREGRTERPIDEISNSADIFTNSPIHRAVLVGNTDVAELLLENDDSLAYLQYEGVFPIHVAARKGHLKMVLLFLERYLDSAELLDHHGRNFLHIAAEENNSSVFVRLLGETKCNKLTYNKLFSFWRKMSARMSGKTNNFELFKKLNKNPLVLIWKKIMARMINETDNEGNTPLHLAVEKRCKSTMFTLLANKKVDINLRNRSLTPFDISVIQVKESTKNSMMMQGWIEKYLENKGAKFIPVWVQAFMPIIDSEGSTTDQIQIVGLGAVLITTVTFAAAFTLPGSNDSNGLPVMGGKYIFKAFMVANSLVFVYSFLCVITLISGGLTPMEPEVKHLYLSKTLTLFSAAARYMVLAFGLGVFLVLNPVNKWFTDFLCFFIFSAAVVDILPNNELKAIDYEVDRNPIPIEMRRPTCSARMKILLRVLPPIGGIFLFALIP